MQIEKYTYLRRLEDSERGGVGLAADNAAVNLQARSAARSQTNARFADLQNALSANAAKAA